MKKGTKLEREFQSKLIKELKDLFSIEQEVNIYKFNIEDLGDIKLTSNQMNAILFMIED